MGPLVCRCGTALTALETKSLRDAWEEWEGVTWSCYSKKQAYWHLCLGIFVCRVTALPGDRTAESLGAVFLKTLTSFTFPLDLAVHATCSMLLESRWWKSSA